ncbi:hypothetical protein KAU39_00785, partial [bacterium]|nr:hypothetical protein [bacterium]
QLQDKIDEIGVGQKVDVMGRYYAMDRDNRWERVQVAYDALVDGKADEYVEVSKKESVSPLTAFAGTAVSLLFGMVLFVLGSSFTGLIEVASAQPDITTNIAAVGLSGLGINLLPVILLGLLAGILMLKAYILSNKKIKDEILNMLDKAENEGLIDSKEKENLIKEIHFLSIPLTEFQKNLKIFLLYREKINEKGGEKLFASWKNTWPLDVKCEDFGEGFKWLCIGAKPQIRERQRKMSVGDGYYYYEGILKEGRLFAYGGTYLDVNNAWLTFRILDDSINESRAKSFSEYIFNKRLEFLGKRFPQIKEFRIWQDQIINFVEKKATWEDTLVCYIKKIGFKPLGNYAKDIYAKILNGGTIGKEDVRLIFPGRADYLYKKNKIEEGSWNNLFLLPILLATMIFIYSLALLVGGDGLIVGSAAILGSIALFRSRVKNLHFLNRLKGVSPLMAAMLISMAALLLPEKESIELEEAEKEFLAELIEFLDKNERDDFNISEIKELFEGEKNPKEVKKHLNSLEKKGIIEKIYEEGKAKRGLRKLSISKQTIKKDILQISSRTEEIEIKFIEHIVEERIKQIKEGKLKEIAEETIKSKDILDLITEMVINKRDDVSEIIKNDAIKDFVKKFDEDKLNSFFELVLGDVIKESEVVAKLFKDYKEGEKTGIENIGLIKEEIRIGGMAGLTKNESLMKFLGCMLNEISDMDSYQLKAFAIIIKSMAKDKLKRVRGEWLIITKLKKLPWKIKVIDEIKEKVREREEMVNLPEEIKEKLLSKELILKFMNKGLYEVYKKGKISSHKADILTKNMAVIAGDYLSEKEYSELTKICPDNMWAFAFIDSITESTKKGDISKGVTEEPVTVEVTKEERLNPEEDKPYLMKAIKRIENIELGPKQIEIITDLVFEHNFDLDEIIRDNRIKKVISAIIARRKGKKKTPDKENKLKLKENLTEKIEEIINRSIKEAKTIKKKAISESLEPIVKSVEVIKLGDEEVIKGNEIDILIKNPFSYKDQEYLMRAINKVCSLQANPDIYRRLNSMGMELKDRIIQLIIDIKKPGDFEKVLNDNEVKSIISPGINEKDLEEVIRAIIREAQKIKNLNKKETIETTPVTGKVIKEEVYNFNLTTEDIEEIIRLLREEEDINKLPMHLKNRALSEDLIKVLLDVGLSKIADVTSKKKPELAKKIKKEISKIGLTNNRLEWAYIRAAGRVAEKKKEQTGVKVMPDAEKSISKGGNNFKHRRYLRQAIMDIGEKYYKDIFTQFNLVGINEIISLIINNQNNIDEILDVKIMKKVIERSGGDINRARKFIQDVINEAQMIENIPVVDKDLAAQIEKIQFKMKNGKSDVTEEEGTEVEVPAKPVFEITEELIQRIALNFYQQGLVFPIGVLVIYTVIEMDTFIEKIALKIFDKEKAELKSKGIEDKDLDAVKKKAVEEFRRGLEEQLIGLQKELLMDRIRKCYGYKEFAVKILAQSGELEKSISEQYLEEIYEESEEFKNEMDKELELNEAVIAVIQDAKGIKNYALIILKDEAQLDMDMDELNERLNIIYERHPNLKKEMDSYSEIVYTVKNNMEKYAGFRESAVCDINGINVEGMTEKQIRELWKTDDFKKKMKKFNDVWAVIEKFEPDFVKEINKEKEEVTNFFITMRKMAGYIDLVSKLLRKSEEEIRVMKEELEAIYTFFVIVMNEEKEGIKRLKAALAECAYMEKAAIGKVLEEYKEQPELKMKKDRLEEMFSALMLTGEEIEFQNKMKEEKDKYYQVREAMESARYHEDKAEQIVKNMDSQEFRKKLANLLEFDEVFKAERIQVPNLDKMIKDIFEDCCFDTAIMIREDNIPEQIFEVISNIDDPSGKLGKKVRREDVINILDKIIKADNEYKEKVKKEQEKYADIKIAVNKNYGDLEAAAKSINKTVDEVRKYHTELYNKDEYYRAEIDSLMDSEKAKQKKIEDMKNNKEIIEKLFGPIIKIENVSYNVIAGLALGYTEKEIIELKMAAQDEFNKTREYLKPISTDNLGMVLKSVVKIKDLEEINKLLKDLKKDDLDKLHILLYCYMVPKADRTLMAKRLDIQVNDILSSARDKGIIKKKIAQINLTGKTKKIIEDFIEGDVASLFKAIVNWGESEEISGESEVIRQMRKGEGTRKISNLSEKSKTNLRTIKNKLMKVGFSYDVMDEFIYAMAGTSVEDINSEEIEKITSYLSGERKKLYAYIYKNKEHKDKKKYTKAYKEALLIMFERALIQLSAEEIINMVKKEGMINIGKLVLDRYKLSDISEEAVKLVKQIAQLLTEKGDELKYISSNNALKPENYKRIMDEIMNEIKKHEIPEDFIVKIASAWVNSKSFQDIVIKMNKTGNSDELIEITDEMYGFFCWMDYNFKILEIGKKGFIKAFQRVILDGEEIENLKDTVDKEKFFIEIDYEKIEQIKKLPITEQIVKEIYAGIIDTNEKSEQEQEIMNEMRNYLEINLANEKMGFSGEIVDKIVDAILQVPSINDIIKSWLDAYDAGKPVQLEEIENIIYYFFKANKKLKNTDYEGEELETLQSLLTKLSVESIIKESEKLENAGYKGERLDILRTLLIKFNSDEIIEKLKAGDITVFLPELYAMNNDVIRKHAEESLVLLEQIALILEKEKGKNRETLLKEIGKQKEVFDVIEGGLIEQFNYSRGIASKIAYAWIRSEKFNEVSRDKELRQKTTDALFGFFEWMKDVFDTFEVKNKDFIDCFCKMILDETKTTKEEKDKTAPDKVLNKMISAILAVSFFAVLIPYMGIGFIGTASAQPDVVANTAAAGLSLLGMSLPGAVIGISCVALVIGVVTLGLLLSKKNIFFTQQEIKRIIEEEYLWLLDQFTILSPDEKREGVALAVSRTTVNLSWLDAILFYSNPKIMYKIAEGVFKKSPFFSFYMYISILLLVWLFEIQIVTQNVFLNAFLLMSVMFYANVMAILIINKANMNSILNRMIFNLYLYFLDIKNPELLLRTIANHEGFHFFTDEKNGLIVYRRGDFIIPNAMTYILESNGKPAEMVDDFLNMEDFLEKEQKNRVRKIILETEDIGDRNKKIRSISNEIEKELDKLNDPKFTEDNTKEHSFAMEYEALNWALESAKVLEETDSILGAMKTLNYLAMGKGFKKAKILAIKETNDILLKAKELSEEMSPENRDKYLDLVKNGYISLAEKLVEEYPETELPDIKQAGLKDKGPEFLSPDEDAVSTPGMVLGLFVGIYAIVLGSLWGIGIPYVFMGLIGVVLGLLVLGWIVKAIGVRAGPVIADTRMKLSYFVKGERRYSRIIDLLYQNLDKEIFQFKTEPGSPSVFLMVEHGYAQKSLSLAQFRGEIDGIDVLLNADHHVDARSSVKPIEYFSEEDFLNDKTVPTENGVFTQIAYAFGLKRYIWLLTKKAREEYRWNNYTPTHGKFKLYTAEITDREGFDMVSSDDLPLDDYRHIARMLQRSDDKREVIPGPIVDAQAVTLEEIDKVEKIEGNVAVSVDLDWFVEDTKKQAKGVVKWLSSDSFKDAKIKAYIIAISPHYSQNVDLPLALKSLIENLVRKNLIKLVKEQPVIVPIEHINDDEQVKVWSSLLKSKEASTSSFASLGMLAVVLGIGILSTLFSPWILGIIGFSIVAGYITIYRNRLLSRLSKRVFTGVSQNPWVAFLILIPVFQQEIQRLMEDEEVLSSFPHKSLIMTAGIPEESNPEIKIAIEEIGKLVKKRKGDKKRFLRVIYGTNQQEGLIDIERERVGLALARIEKAEIEIFSKQIRIVKEIKFLAGVDKIKTKQDLIIIRDTIYGKPLIIKKIANSFQTHKESVGNILNLLVNPTGAQKKTLLKVFELSQSGKKVEVDLTRIRQQLDIKGRRTVSLEILQYLGLVNFDSTVNEKNKPIFLEFYSNIEEWSSAPQKREIELRVESGERRKQAIDALVNTIRVEGLNILEISDEELEQLIRSLNVGNFEESGIHGLRSAQITPLKRYLQEIRREGTLIPMLVEKSQLRTLSLQRIGDGPLFTARKDVFIEKDWIKVFWEKIVYNAAAVKIKGIAYVLYRAMGHDRESRIGLRWSKDGINKEEGRLDKPIFTAERDYERPSPEVLALRREDHIRDLDRIRDLVGVEDPRVIIIGDRMYMTYTAYGDKPQLAFASISVEDFLAKKWDKWERHGLIFPGMVNKNAVLIDYEGGLLLLHRMDEKNIYSMRFDNIDGLLKWIEKAKTMEQEAVKKYVEENSKLILPSRSVDEKIGAGAQIIKTEYGWLNIFHAVEMINGKRCYTLHVALHDLNNPEEILYRSSKPILKPEKEWEKNGWVDNVVFTCGAVPKYKDSGEMLNGEDQILVYYAGADEAMAVAEARINDLIPQRVRERIIKSREDKGIVHWQVANGKGSERITYSIVDFEELTRDSINGDKIFKQILNISRSKEWLPNTIFEIEKLFYDKKNIRILVKSGNKILGYLVVEPDGYVLCIAVREGYRDKGIGLNMFYAGAEKVGKRGGKTILLEYPDIKPNPAKFYESLAEKFKVINKTKSGFYQTGDPAILIEYDIREDLKTQKDKEKQIELILGNLLFAYLKGNIEAVVEEFNKYKNE